VGFDRTTHSAFSGFLKGAGLDLKKLQTAQGQHGALQQRLVERQKRDALRYAVRQKTRLHASVLGQRKAWQALGAQGDIFPYPSFTLSTPLYISSRPDFLVDYSAHVPFGSWAKFKYVSSKSSGAENVGFYFLWRSPFSDYAVINATTSFSATGWIQAHAPWRFWINESYVNATAQFNVWIGFPNGAAPAAGVAFYLADIGAMATFLTGSDTEGNPVTAGLTMSNLMVAIPPQAAVFFEVALALYYTNEDPGGNIEVDFESGDFNIACPVVVYSILNQPPLA
jgi:hypothetical protein